MKSIPTTAACLVAAALAGCSTVSGQTTHSGYAASMERYEQAVAAHKERMARDRAEKQAAHKAECDRKGGIRVGMSREQVYASCWGKPERINKTTSAGGDREQLVYRGYNYVYLHNGVVTSIQTSE